MSILSNVLKTKPILTKLILLTLALCIMLVIFSKAHIAFHVFIISYIFLSLFSESFQSELGFAENFKVTSLFILMIYLFWFVQPSRQFRPNSYSAVFFCKPWSLEVALFLVFGQIQFVWSIIYFFQNIKKLKTSEIILLLTYGLTISCVSILTYILYVRHIP